MAMASKPLNVVVIGHVDAGKSTLLGHLMEYLNPSKSSVRSKPRKSKEEASELYSWALDEQIEERERGLTLDYHVKHLNIGERLVTFIDSPGHSELIFHTLKGAMLADVALLVVDANDIKTGNHILQPQTIEHSKLARVLGISQVILVINKMDLIDWSQELFKQIKSEVLDFLTGPEVGSKKANIHIVPISAKEGIHMINLEGKSEESMWWNGPTLLSILKEIRVPFSSKRETLISIADAWTTTKGQAAAAKVVSGSLSVGDEVLVSPYQSKAICRSIHINNESVTFCNVGQYIDCITLGNFNESLFAGCVLCDPLHPLPVSRVFNALLVIFPINQPISPGQNLLIQIHNNYQPCFISKIIGLVDKGTGHLSAEKPPRFLLKKHRAIVQITCENKICYSYKTRDEANMLCRVVLRRGKISIAAGFVCEPT